MALRYNLLDYYDACHSEAYIFSNKMLQILLDILFFIRYTTKMFKSYRQIIVGATAHRTAPHRTAHIVTLTTFVA